MSEKSSWRIAPPPIPDSEITEVYTADVVIVGSGHAGTCAARAAAEAGASVIVLEQQEEDDMRFYSGGEVGHINSKFLAGRGVEPVDVAEFCNDWQLRSNNRSNYRLIRRFAENSGDAFDWLIEPLTQEQRDKIYLKFSTGNEKWKGSLNGIKTWFGSVMVGGPVLADLMRANMQIAKDKGARFLHEMAACQLTKENGRVTGVIVENEDGEYCKAVAKKGVIIASGDFSGNAEMVRDLLVEIADMYDEGVEILGDGQDGTGIKIAVWAGARLEPRTIPAMGGYYAYPGMGIIGTAGTLYTNKHGRRYCNEFFGFQHISHFAGLWQPNGKLWATFDSNVEEMLAHQAPGHSAFDAGGRSGNIDRSPATLTKLQRLHQMMDGARAAGSEGYNVTNVHMCQKIGRLYCGETIEELASYIYPDDAEASENYLETVWRYNHLCYKGVDEDFGKEAVLMHALDKPPFYAYGTVKDSSRPQGIDAYYLRVTVGGLLTDEFQNVLGQDWEPIPGLYATGNTCGGRFGLQYFTPVGGISLGMCHTLGREAGRTVAAL